MTAYTPDTYRVTLFDRFGAKIRTLPALSFLCAQDVGRIAVSRAEAHSYTISRVLFNSLAPNFERWDVKQR